MRKWIKRLFSVVDAAYTVIDFITFLAFLAFPLALTSSNVLRGFIATGAIFGAVCGYYFSLAWAGKGRNACKRQRNIRAVLFPLPTAAGLLLMSAVNPNFVRRHPSLVWLREELVTSPWWTDALIGLAVFGSVFLLISSITLSSPKLWNARLKELIEVQTSAELKMPKE